MFWSYSYHIKVLGLFVGWLFRSYSGGTRLREKERKYSEVLDHTVCTVVISHHNFCHFIKALNYSSIQ